MNLSEEYAAARADAASKKGYSFVENTAEYSLEFAKRYLKEQPQGVFSNETKKIGRKFNDFLHQRTTVIEPEKITDEEIKQYFAELKEKCEKLLEQYYQKYKRKIDMKYFQEYIESAKQDLENVYQTYCLINKKEINPADINIEEIEETIRLIQAKEDEEER